MKKVLVLMLIAALMLPTVAFAAKGGVAPCLATCCLGPRTGLEMNEGSSIRLTEWLRLVPFVNQIVPLYNAYEGYTGKTMAKVAAEERLGGVRVQAVAPAKKGGVVPGLVACCFGPRVGLEMNEGRKVRTMEWIGLVVPVIPSAIIAYEAYQGKTMSQVAAAEGLDR